MKGTPTQNTSSKTTISLVQCLIAYAGDHEYPKNGQKHLRNPKSLFHCPSVSSSYTQAVTKKQLPEECEGTAQTPPCRWSRTKRTAYEKWNMPASVDTEEYGDSRVKAVLGGRSRAFYWESGSAVSIAGRIERRQVDKVRGMCCRIAVKESGLIGQQLSRNRAGCFEGQLRSSP